MTKFRNTLFKTTSPFQPYKRFDVAHGLSRIGVAARPQELIEGLEKMMQETGLSNSFLD